jgi:serine/threonine-protein kinase
VGGPTGAGGATIQLGRYQLLDALGVGGMAEVFRARTFGPGGFERQVVIKRIQPVHGSDPEFVKMFVDEAKILGMLHHPNVVQVYDFGDDDGTLFLAMEYVDGPSISRVLRSLRGSGRKMPPAIAAYIAREVCRALDYVHNLGGPDGQPLRIVHRDVTPSNIVLTSSGGLKLLDFGVAKFKSSEQLTRAGTVKGKPAYLAPEQLEGRKIDGRVDIFALGVVLHEMLSLEHLFAGDSDLVTVKKVMEMKIPVPSSKRADVPPELDAIVMRALERDRSRRYGDAAEMARDLDEYVVSSRLHLGEVVAFIRSVEAENRARRAANAGTAALRPIGAAAPRGLVGPRQPEPARAGAGAREPERENDRTRKDIGLPFKVSMLGRHFWARASRRRGAAVASAVLVAAALATALGLRVSITTTKNVAKAAEGATPMLIQSEAPAPALLESTQPRR